MSDALPTGQQQTLSSYRGDEQTQSQVSSMLASNGRLDPTGAYDVAIEFDGMRLRSGFSAVMWGAMAGADRLNVTVRVMNGSSQIKSFKTSTSTALGGAIYGSPTKRMNRMVATLSKRIVASL